MALGVTWGTPSLGIFHPCAPSIPAREWAGSTGCWSGDAHWCCPSFLPRAASPRCITGCLLVSRWQVQMFAQLWTCDGSVLVWWGNANIAARNEGSSKMEYFELSSVEQTSYLFCGLVSCAFPFSKIHSFHSSKTFPSSQWEDSSGETAGEVPTVDNRSNFLCAF